MTARDSITAIVLADGTPDTAVRSALAARPFAARVLIAERSSHAVAHMSVRTLPADVAVVAYDWASTATAAALLEEVDSPWVLFLCPGERLACDDLQEFEQEFAELALGPVELRGVGRTETRLHPPSAEALEAVGGSAPARLRHLTLVPLTNSPEIPVDAELETPREAAQSPGPLFGALPSALQVGGRLQGALSGADLPALDYLLTVLDRHEERRLLAIARNGRDVCWTDDSEAEPLVTIRIATYDRPDLIGRAIESSLAQTHARVEVLVVGDCCTDKTAAVVNQFRDPRLRFINLPARGMYPSELVARWRVAGSLPANAALVLGHGSWITACDDDDEFTPDHVEVLLREARARRLEMVYSQAEMEMAAGRWEVLGSAPLRVGQVTQGSVLYSMGLRFLRFSNTCWRREQPADFDLWSRMEAIGVRTGFVERVTYKHGLETYQRSQR